MGRGAFDYEVSILVERIHVLQFEEAESHVSFTIVSARRLLQISLPYSMRKTNGRTC